MTSRLRSVTFVTALLLAVVFPALPASPAPAWFFMQLSDPQFGMYTANADFAQETANFEFAIAAANRVHPAFVVVTGDLVNKEGDAQDIAEHEHVASKLDRTIPHYNVAGNADAANTAAPT